MPIFEFNCETCGKGFEELLRSAAAIEGLKCPACGSLKVQRKLSRIATRVAGGVALGNTAFIPPNPSGHTCRTST